MKTAGLEQRLDARGIGKVAPDFSPNKLLTRSAIAQCSFVPIHTARNWSKAQISVGEWPPGSGLRVVLKDLRGRPLWFRLLSGRNALAREWRALQVLRDMKAVPNPVARIDADAIVMEARSGRPVAEVPLGALPVEVIEELAAFIVAMHRRGVAHGDMHGTNILLGEHGALSVIDWATASIFSGRRLGWRDVSVATLKALDERSVLKLKLLHAPATLTAAERESLKAGPTGLYRAVKRVRFWLAKLRGKKPSREFMFLNNDMHRLLAAAEELGEKDS